MSGKVRLINGKGDWTQTPPTGASDADLMHSANDFVVQSGVLDLLGGDCKVTQILTPAMKVQVASGIVYVLNSSWTPDSFEPRFYQVVRPDSEQLDVASNSSGSTRVDLVCQSIDKVTTPNDDASNVCDLITVVGTPGDGAPSLPDDYELLATLTLPDGTTSAVTNAMITDSREGTYMTPNATNPGFTVVADASSITLDLLYGKHDRFFTTVQGNRPISFANAPIGKYFSVYVQQGSGGAKAYTFSNSILWSEGAAPDPATDAGSIDEYVFVKLPTGDFSGTLAAGNKH